MNPNKLSAFSNKFYCYSLLILNINQPFSPSLFDHTWQEIKIFSWLIVLCFASGNWVLIPSDMFAI